MRCRHARRDVGLGFDGDGDRCGVVDDTGAEIFADKVGVMLARDFSAIHKSAQFVVDVKSTGLFITDPVLERPMARRPTYWKTGHSYIKRRTAELGALAGFEKSGHFFFNPPLGRGYDDADLGDRGLEMLDARRQIVAELKDALPQTWGSPTMSPLCPDEAKYGVVEACEAFQAMQAKGEKVAGRDPRSRHRQRRARYPRRRHLGPGAGLLQPARSGGGGGEPSSESHARHVRSD